MKPKAEDIKVAYPIAGYKIEGIADQTAHVVGENLNPREGENGYLRDERFRRTMLGRLILTAICALSDKTTNFTYPDCLEVWKAACAAYDYQRAKSLSEYKEWKDHPNRGDDVEGLQHFPKRSTYPQYHQGQKLYFALISKGIWRGEGGYHTNGEDAHADIRAAFKAANFPLEL